MYVRHRNQRVYIMKHTRFKTGVECCILSADHACAALVTWKPTVRECPIYTLVHWQGRLAKCKVWWFNWSGRWGKFQSNGDDPWRVT